MNENSANLIQMVNELQDKLSPFGGLALDLPQIAVIGGQSAGKSSVLEGFVGRDFLPRGNNIVTRRPLVLQLINNKDNPKSFGEFSHISGQLFYDFSQIRDEINNETDREVNDNYGISSKPINLKIYSPDVLDLTLVDLPGMTRIPVGNQPKDIESRIESMILEYIEHDNCLILAVTAANQDLATSDALKMAERVDPNGERTIGVLTKLDLMDKGTDARDILIGKHLPLKMGYIGVINRSQKDIQSKKDMKSALAEEQHFFKNHPAYKDISDKLGMSFLQKFLNVELTKHILKLLPPLKRKFVVEFNDLSEQLDKIKIPNDGTDCDWILSQTNEELRQNYESSIGGKGIQIDITKLSGGAKINLIMNSKFAKEINQMVYNEERLRREIATAIQNYYGIYLGVFTPDAAFKAVVEHQIELFRKPSVVCVEWVSQELEEIIKESVGKIKRFSKLKHIYAQITLDYVRECKKRCKQKVDNYVEAEKTYLNTLHDDFIRTTSFVENSKPMSVSQLLVSAQVVDEKLTTKDEEKESSDKEPKMDWISYKKHYYWFVLKGRTLTWFKDDKMKDKRNSVSLKGAKLEQSGQKGPEVLVLILNKKSTIFSAQPIELMFESTDSALQWREWFEESGVRTNGRHSSFYADSDNNSVSNMSTISQEEEMAYADHMKSPVAQVKTLIDSYFSIMKKKFKDYIPKMCAREMIDSTRDFIAIGLRLNVRNSITSVDDIINGDPDEELRRDLLKKTEHYSQGIAIIEKFTKYDST